MEGVRASWRAPTLAVPVEAIFLFALIHSSTEKLLQYLEVYFPFREGLGKERLELFDVPCDQVRGLGFGVFDAEFLHLSSFKVLLLLRPVRIQVA